MRLAVFGAGLAVLTLASCAPGGPSVASRDTKSPAQGIVLTVRPVPAGDARAADLLRAGTPPAVATATEYVVRTTDGATLAIVQAANPALHPGAAVTILREDRATLAAR